MHDIDSPLNPRGKKTSTCELVAEYQSSTSSTTYNIMTKQEQECLLQYVLDKCRPETASSSPDKGRERDAKQCDLIAN